MYFRSRSVQVGSLDNVRSLPPSSLSPLPAMSALTTKLALLNGRAASVPVGLFINNAWHASSDGGTFPTVNPATGAHLADFAHATSADVDKAVGAARLAFNTTWGRNSLPGERARRAFPSSPLPFPTNACNESSAQQARGPNGARRATPRRTRECERRQRTAYRA
jgi:hypothetical protein